MVPVDADHGPKHPRVLCRVPTPSFPYRRFTESAECSSRLTTCANHTQAEHFALGHDTQNETLLKITGTQINSPCRARAAGRYPGQPMILQLPNEQVLTQTNRHEAGDAQAGATVTIQLL